VSSCGRCRYWEPVGKGYLCNNYWVLRRQECVGKNQTKLNDATDEFPLRSYGPSLGRAGEIYSIVTKSPETLLRFRTPTALKYILSNASFEFAMLEGCLKSTLENELSEVLKSLRSHNRRNVHSSRRV
jgi:hypothetical protein